MMNLDTDLLHIRLKSGENTVGFGKGFLKRRELACVVVKLRLHFDFSCSR